MLVHGIFIGKYFSTPVTIMFDSIVFAISMIIQMMLHIEGGPTKFTLKVLSFQMDIFHMQFQT